MITEELENNNSYKYMTDDCACKIFKHCFAGYNCTVIQQNSPGQADPVQQNTLVYADIGPSSVNKRTKQLRPDDIDDRVEYAVLKHGLQKPATQDSIAGI